MPSLMDLGPLNAVFAISSLNRFIEQCFDEKTIETSDREVGNVCIDQFEKTGVFASFNTLKTSSA